MKVTVYSTSICPYCDKAKDFLKKNRIKFREIDVNKDKNAAVEMIKKSGQNGVPVIDIDGEIITGFDEKKLKQALKIK
jgi:glutaredoxin-like YruB-family protein